MEPGRGQAASKLEDDKYLTLVYEDDFVILTNQMAQCSLR